MTIAPDELRDPARSGVLTAGRNPVEDDVPGVTFAEWVRPHWTVLQRYAARAVGPDDRDDLLQDTLERAWRKWHTFDPDRGAARAWLIAICADRARRRRTRGRSTPAGLSDGAEPVATSQDHARDLTLRAAVQQLPERRRTAVELHYYVGLTVSEVAAAMGCADGTARATLAAARAQLRAALHEDEEATDGTR